MRGIVPILSCDHEDGCTEWIIDEYELGIAEWREGMPGWTYNPYKSRDSSYCPDHKKED